MATQVKTDVVNVDADGTLKVPRDVLEDAGFAPGDEIFFWSPGSRKLQLRAVSTVSPQELFERFGDPTVTDLDWPTLREEAEQVAAEEVIAKMRRSSYG